MDQKHSRHFSFPRKYQEGQGRRQNILYKIAKKKTRTKSGPKIFCSRKML